MHGGTCRKASVAFLSFSMRMLFTANLTCTISHDTGSSSVILPQRYCVVKRLVSFCVSINLALQVNIVHSEYYGLCWAHMFLLVNTLLFLPLLH